MAWLDSKRSRDSVGKIARRRPGGQPAMGKNLGNDPGLFDGGDDLEVAAPA
jgi:hypothetical protein